ncbi:hypothetical protein [Actinomadura harenae]|uniref:Uncharacterized protein n=1 Tax=Actinomadura harenae TaxID=2483351 RepID=A0A3M2LZR9_9ACTN|nr:hypothetical protein [Actinomadura harenae]RMI42083.1 hypothetical protein EBO15_20750 [Actinomadura harenae]
MRDLLNRLLGGLDHDRPRYGYGRGRRPLWDERNRDAERIRRALRKAGLKEFSDRHGGFVVENGEESGPFSVAAALSPVLDQVDIAVVMADYTRALTAHGWRVGPDTGPDFQEQILEVWITPG